MLDLAAPIRLDNRVTIAERVTILTHMNVGYRDHPLQAAFPARTEPVHLEEGTFVGSGSTILCGCRIGKCAFVAAGSVVTRSQPAESLIGGVPAKVIRAVEIGATASPGGH
jgi:acetyltransferase-like isoleucine patch superfamily enzyme